MQLHILEYLILCDCDTEQPHLQNCLIDALLQCLIQNSHSDLKTTSLCYVLDTLEWLVLFTVHIKPIHL